LTRCTGTRWTRSWKSWVTILRRPANGSKTRRSTANERSPTCRFAYDFLVCAHDSGAYSTPPPKKKDITLAMDELGVDAEDLEVYALSQPPFKWTRGQFPNFPVQPPTLKGAKAALAQATSANPFGIVPRMKDLLEAVETASTSVPTIAATSTAASGVTAAPSITPSPSSATSGAPSAPKSTPPRLKLSFGGRSLLSVPLSSTSSSAAGAATSLIMPSSALGVEDPLVDEARLAAARLRTKNDLKRRIDEGGSSKRSRTTERLLSVQQ